jgi:hypothetical protein
LKQLHNKLSIEQAFTEQKSDCPVLILLNDKNGHQCIVDVKYVGHYDDAIYIQVYEKDFEFR